MKTEPALDIQFELRWIPPHYFVLSVLRTNQPPRFHGELVFVSVIERPFDHARRTELRTADCRLGLAPIAARRIDRFIQRRKPSAIGKGLITDRRNHQEIARSG